MKTVLIATAVALGIGSSAALAAGAGHGPEKPGASHDMASGGHARHEDTVGKPGDPKKVSRTVKVVMSDDMKFAPASIKVKRGETIRFVVRNAGRIRHEMVIGSMKELKEHAEMMRKMPEMEHAEANQVTLDAGKTGELLWQFTRAGTFDFACLQPGHFEAGMVGKMIVK